MNSLRDTVESVLSEDYDQSEICELFELHGLAGESC